MKTVPKSITNKQLQIVVLLYRFRFLTRIHIQQFLNHKSHSLITSWLKDLTNRNIIARSYSRTIENINKPATYYLSLQSRPILIEKSQKKSNDLNRVYREKLRSSEFRSHSLFIADLYFYFLKAAQQRGASINFLTATDLQKYAYTPFARPDAYIVIKELKNTKRYFLHVIDDETPYFVIKNKVKHYVTYYREGCWQKHYTYPFPKILLIVPTVKIHKMTERFISQLLSDEDISVSFFLALRKDIEKNGFQMNIWKQVVSL